ncbi:MAG TPA: hypothetical protein QF776_10585 [Acidimicrobiales bacterium]|nr:hypothetical protein [Acidimicrobiales bacterium]
MRASLRSIIRRFVNLSRASVDHETTDATAARLANLARAGQPLEKEPSRSRVVRGLGFLGTIGVAGWVATGVAAAVTVSTLVATNSMPKPIQSFSADVIETFRIDDIFNFEAPRPAKKKPDTKPEEIPDTKPEEIPDTKPEEKPDTKPEEKPDTKPEEIPDTKPEEKPDTKPEEIPDTKPEEIPDTKPEEIPEQPPPVATPEPEPPIDSASRMKAFIGVDSAATALVKLEGLAVVEYDDSCTGSYDRDEWPHWSSVGPEDGEPAGKSLNTRHNELRKESLTDVTYSDSNRSVAGGLWNLVYVEGTTTNPSDLDAEHVLPLANMHVRACSAGIVFTESEREVLANDPDLVFVADDGANQSRGAKSWASSPYGSGWFPPNASVHCDWLQIQIQLLDKYTLPVTGEEVSVARTKLTSC